MLMLQQNINFRVMRSKVKTHDISMILPEPVKSRYRIPVLLNKTLFRLPFYRFEATMMIRGTS